MSAALPMLAALSDVGHRQWNLSYEGISPGWAFLLFLVLAVGMRFALDLVLRPDSLYSLRPLDTDL